VSELAWEPDEEDLAFLDLYGDWDPLTPAETAALMEGFPHPWWIVGGHAIEAFTGVRRFHEDLDLVIFTDTVPDLHRHLAGRFHLWNVHDRAFRLIDQAHAELFHPQSQVWLRKDARSPWRVDCILEARDDQGRWVSKRDPDHVAELDDVTWVAGDGIRYLRPEIQLFFKAKQDRAKDRVDLDNTWPLLDTDRRAWLRDALAVHLPDHPWRERLGA
jgi:hypothetical protein